MATALDVHSEQFDELARAVRRDEPAGCLVRFGKARLEEPALELGGAEGGAAVAVGGALDQLGGRGADDTDEDRVGHEIESRALLVVPLGSTLLA